MKTYKQIEEIMENTDISKKPLKTYYQIKETIENTKVYTPLASLKQLDLWKFVNGASIF